MISEEKKQVLELFAEGRKLYKLMRFQEAADKFSAAVMVDPTEIGRAHV